MLDWDVNKVGKLHLALLNMVFRKAHQLCKAYLQMQVLLLLFQGQCAHSSHQGPQCLKPSQHVGPDATWCARRQQQCAFWCRRSSFPCKLMG